MLPYQFYYFIFYLDKLPTMSSNLSFRDFNFKLAVVQELMYNQQVLTPAFDLDEFLATEVDREIDLEEEGYSIIPEVKAYFKRLNIPAKHASLVEQLEQDGGDDIYMQLCPFWDGEDDLFNIRTAADADQFPNLKTVVLFYDEDDAILQAFEEQGVDASWL